MIFKYILCVFLSLCVVKQSSSFQFEDITSEIFPIGEDTGVIAAYGHFNNDEFTDVVTLQQGGNKLQLLKGSENKPYFQPSMNCSFPNGEVVTSVVPADFNGDSLLDVLITVNNKDKPNVEVRILWGNGSDNFECKTESLFSLSVQPFVVDFNGDMIPDIIGETPSGERTVWISSKKKTFSNHSIAASGKKFRKIQSSGLIDLNHDMMPDIVMTGENEFEIWLNEGKGFNYIGSRPYPDLVYKWQSTFVDINMDGRIDHILPVCYDSLCHKSAIKIWNTNDSQWYDLVDHFYNPGDKSMWGFRFPYGSALEKAALPTTLRFGDVDLDGYPDFLAVLQKETKATDLKTVILKNVPCDTCITGRSLEIVWDVPGVDGIKNVQLASFFDLFEDGLLDILVSVKNNGQWKIKALRNTEIVDSCFLKVLILSGLCYRDCSTEPYGVNQPGPIVRYNMTKEDGQPVVSSAVQLSQSAHFPLQLPYSMFGLGPTPNFIDVLTVSVPARYNVSVNKREWLQIIPNSQIVVIPYPPEDSSKWVKKLFVTPSRLVMLTCVSLFGTCIFISILVGFLHWKERREDKKEKMQDAYRFPFDAM